MKLKIAILFLLVGFSLHARFMKATVLFNDGHAEQGFVKSFLEDEFINLGLFQTMEDELNLDDKTVKFKTDENAEIRVLSINDIDKLTIHYESGNTTEFKVLFLKSIKANGEIIERKNKVWFPLIKQGKVNVYGYKIISYGSQTSIGYNPGGLDYVYYYQNEKENYAINPLENVHLFNIEKTTTIFILDLFKDCPEYCDKLKEKLKFASTKEGKKLEKETRKNKLETYGKGTDKNSILNVYETTFYGFSDAIAEYEKECPRR